MSPSKWVTALVAVACVSCQAKPDKPVIRIHVTEMACYVENLTARTLYDVRLKLLNPDTRVVSGGGMPYVFWKGGSKNVDVFPGSLPVFQAPAFSEESPRFEAYSEGVIIPSVVSAQPISPSASSLDYLPRR